MAIAGGAPGTVALAVALMLARAGVDDGPRIKIEHQAPDCLVAEHHAKLTACFTPAEDVARARVHYTANGAKWEYTTMAPAGACFAAVLPGIRPGSSAFRYYVQAVDTEVRQVRSAEYAPVVVENAAQCPGTIASHVDGGAAGGPARRKRNLALPLVLVVGGGTAAASAALLGGGSSDPGSASTTTPTTTPATTPPDGSQPTATTAPATMPPAGSQPPATTAPAATTTTTTPPGTSPPGTTTPATTTTSSTTTTTTTTTTTMPPPCEYALSPHREFGLLGGNGLCNVATNRQGCSWTLEVFPSEATAWLRLEGAVSGSGNGAVNYSVASLGLGTRTAQIQARESPGAFCRVTQASGFVRPARR
jgi:hypothetical protein